MPLWAVSRRVQDWDQVMDSMLRREVGLDWRASRKMLSSHCGVHTAHVSSYVRHGMKQVVQPALGLVAAGPVLLNGQSTSVPIPVSAHVSFATTATVQHWGLSVRVDCMKDRGTCKENSFQESVGRQIWRETWPRMMSQVGWLMLASLRRSAATKTAG